MPDVVGIRFKRCGKIYDFTSGDLELKRGETVVVESDLGLSIGNVVIESHMLPETTKELKKVLRRATEEDAKQRKDNEDFGTEARSYCQKRIMARGLPMKLIHAEVTLDRKRIIFYFTAESRIDFRELVKDLAAKFKTRIEMRQIGVRDEAKLIGGIGICGQELCCKTFLTSFEPISIRMAKSQELVLNASKLSGVCGRLMCCLSYEYLERGKDELPERGGQTASEEQAEEGARAVREQPSRPPDRPAAEPALSGERAWRTEPRTPPGAAIPGKAAPREERPPEVPPPGVPPEGETVKPEGTAAAGQGGERSRRRFRRRRRRGKRPEK